MSLDSPRLLLVTPSVFNPYSGGGITFTNLFKGWPKDRIAAVHSDSLTPTVDVCDRYYRLSDKEFSPIFPFSSIKKLYRSGRESSSSGGARIVTSFSVGSRLRSFFIGDEMPVSATLSKELTSFIQEFKPEVMYTILGSLPYISLVQKIAERFHLPVVIHMMDDWPEVIYRRSVFDLFRRTRMHRLLQTLMQDAAVCLGISPAMCHAYQKRYGRTFLPFHNALESERWLLKARKKQSQHPSPFVIVYAGALLENSQLQSVRDVADAVSALAGEGLNIEFRVYAPWYATKAFGHELRGGRIRQMRHLALARHVKVFDAPDDDGAMQRCFTEADLLLLPVNFDAATVKYVRYSMPTKIPAYMFSGTPTLAYGPESVASIQYATKEHWAYAVTRRDPKLLREAIRTLIFDPEQRARFATVAQKLAISRHDATKVRRQFHDVFIRAFKAPIR